MSHKVIQRTSGQATPLIVVVTLVVALIGIFAFEITRAAMIRDQLRSATESAALGGATALAGSTRLDPMFAQTKAIDAAKSMFVLNDIFGQRLDKVENDFDSNPEVGHCKLRFEYLDPKHNNAVVPVGDPKAKILRVSAKYGFTPIFASMVGAKSMPILVDATGGVGDLDVVLCFDVSGSMDDETLMTEVRRRWDPAQNKIVYDVVNKGKLATSIGAVPPLQLTGSFNARLRGPQEHGTPPGNFPPGTAAVSGFTDSVVNLDESTDFAGLTADGFNFPNVGALVEASRGNLEDGGVFHDSKADSALAGLVTPKSGYQAEYQKLAKQHTHPIFEAQQAATDFFRLMNQNANPHFGLVAFDDQIGTDPSTALNQPKVSTSFLQAGNAPVPLPAIALKKPEDDNNFDVVVPAIDPLVAFGGTNIGGAASKAIDMFDTGSRTNAKKVVIIFTDGEPTSGGPLSGDPFQNCILAAQKARQKGIAIYSVGLALNSSLIPIQQRVLGHDTPTGMANIAGNGGRYFPVTSASNIKDAFASIARQLCSLVD